ncbi:hybrid sensor histidine kinase/response regulator [Solidesulfovibrio alcoholivorans]|uniref:hybrid sensor histidine kinase/response regulator n=1 Tax=Solidesulfovibrio alcoholivorans TaxID=81406 RepID=UPI0004960F93|nr:response regulator [Solidesulfovibrio alcoholivorans]
MSETLLLVDDEEDIRRFLGLFLADLGYVVHAAANGEEALAVLDEVDPSIVLTDIKMPVMDGLELLKRIKARNPDIEVVMISGHGDMDLAISCLQNDAADFVTKPINHDILDAALKRIDEKLAMRRELRQYTQNLEKLVREKSSRVVELERQLAAGQMAETMCQAISGLSADLGEGTGYFNEMPCFVAVHNASLEVVATNQLYKDRLGDMVGRHSWEVYAGQALRGFTGPIWKTFETGKGQRCRETMLCKNGNELPVMVHTSPIAATNGKVELVLEMAVDVSEIKRLQEELRVTQQKYMDLFDATPCYIAVRDREGTVVANNHRFVEDFGEGVGRACHDVFAHRSEPCPDCPAALTFADGEPHYHETVVTTRDCRQRNVLISTAAIRNAAGEVVEVMEMSADITSIRELQSHLTSLGLMLGSISHGVKGMLTALEGAVYRVESGLRRGDIPRSQAAAEAVRTLVGRVRALVLNVLYYAKSRELAPETVDVAAFAASMAQTVAPKAAREGVALETAIGADLGEMAVDAVNLQAALVNILENAVDACVADTAKPAHRIAFRISREGRTLVFDIEDNGMGMDQETREKAFTLFFSSKGLRGTGLGLFIANDMVVKHGGSIALASEPGVGTHFSVRIPETPPAPAEAVREAATS